MLCQAGNVWIEYTISLFQIKFYSAIFYGVLLGITHATFLQLKIQLETARFEVFWTPDLSSTSLTHYQLSCPDWINPSKLNFLQCQNQPELDRQCGNCCIFWPAFGCCSLQSLVKILFFNIFCARKLKKWKESKKFGAKWSKMEQKIVFF